MNNKKIKFFQKNGFTMIELLVVIVIIGILSVIGLGAFTSSQVKARDSQRKSDLRTISNALETYYNDFGKYPIGQNGFIFGCGVNANSEVCSPGQVWENATSKTTYMIQMPEDPKGGFYYYVSEDGSSYQIYVSLENDKDRDVPKSAKGAPLYYTTPAPKGCVIGYCNYGRSSSNVTLGATSE